MPEENKKKAARPKRGLGKGLNALFGESGYEPEKAALPEPEKQSEAAKSDVTVKISSIIVNEKQPRKNFDEEELSQLTESVRQYGVLQPLLVKKEGEKFRIIAGERRYRAAKEAGLKEIPVVVRDYTSQQAAEVSIIENVQRADLNPMEEAMAYQMLIDDYGLKQEEIAGKVSKNRTTITNALRLLKLSDKVRQMVAQGSLSAGHARTLVPVEDEEIQYALAKEVIDKQLSVRETERLVKQSARKKPERKNKIEPDYSIYYREYEDKMKEILGTKVHINRRDKNKGRIEIDYYSQNELERIMELLSKIRDAE